MNRVERWRLPGGVVVEIEVKQECEPVNGYSCVCSREIITRVSTVTEHRELGTRLP